jgi:ribosomal protein S18 acetylase RimI-like enzyme
VEYSLRELREDEAEALYALHRESMGAYVEATWGAWDDYSQRITFRERLERGVLRVVEVEGAIAGILEVTHREDCHYVDNIQLSTAFRRQGLGTQLLHDVMATASAAGLPVRLTVLRVNPARRLYQRLGFVEIDLTETHHHLKWDPSAG